MDFLKALLLALVSVFAPIKGLLIATMGIVFADLIIGLLAARKRKEKITSAGLRRTIVKICLYEVAIMFAHLLQIYFIPEIPAVKLVAGAIGLVEAKSLMENAKDLGLDLSVLKTFLGSDNDKK